MSGPYQIKNGNLTLEANFVYHGDFNIEIIVTPCVGKMALDNFGNRNYEVKIIAGNPSSRGVITRMTLKDVDIWPVLNEKKDNNGNSSGDKNISFNIFCKKGESKTSFIQLLTDIQNTLSAFVGKGTLFPKPKPYFSEFNFECPKWEESLEEYKAKHNKEKKPFTDGITVATYPHEKKYFKLAVPMMHLSSRDKIVYLTSTSPLTKNVLAEYNIVVNKIRQEGAANGIFIEKVYNRSMAELNSMSEDKLAELGRIVDTDTFVSTFKSMKFATCILNFGKLKSSSRAYSSFKMILSWASVSPRTSVEDRIEEEGLEMMNSQFDDIKKAADSIPDSEFAGMEDFD